MGTTPAAAPGLRLFFAGDVRLSDEFAGSLFDAEVDAFARAHDVRCCNFEGAAYHERAVTKKKAGPAILQGRTACARVLESGFDLISLANNHVMDYGTAGLDAALDAFSGVAVIGAGDTASTAYQPYILEQNGIKAGFLAVTERQYGTLDGLCAGAGTAWACAPEARNNIRLLKCECSHVVVVCHAGLEGADQPLAEWRALYRGFIDAGASAVVCHHPHVPQGCERYKQGAIFYSLGNLAWEPGQEFASQNSLVASVTLLADGGLDFTVRPVVYEQGRVRFDASGAAGAHLAEMNGVLCDERAYVAAVHEICRAFYEREAVPQLFAVTGSLPGNGWQQMKNAGKLLVRRPALNEPLLRHLLANESFRYAVLEATRG